MPGRMSTLYEVRLRRMKKESKERCWERQLRENWHRLDPVTRKLIGSPRWKALEIALQARQPIPVDPEMIRLMARTAQ